MTKKEKRLLEARAILMDLGMPAAQLNERSALCLLALVNLSLKKQWADCESPLIGITPIMDWAKDNFSTNYAPNTRETFRRQSMHQFIEAGICLYNPDKPDRPVNSPGAVYQIEPNLLAMLKTFDSPSYKAHLARYLASRKTLTERYAKARKMAMIPVTIKKGQKISLSPGEHSMLIKKILEEFATRYAPGGELIYVGDTGDKYGHFDKAQLASLSVKLNDHGKMPDVVIHIKNRNWLLLIESVTSHGPVDAKRQIELSKLFKDCTAGLVFVSAFPTRKVFLKHMTSIAWESEVWIADAPDHLIHFNGERFLGPYDQS